MKCSLYDDAENLEICDKDCGTCTWDGEDYNRYQIYRYDELYYGESRMSGTEGQVTICCPACKRMKVYHMREYWNHAEEYKAQGNCKECKYCKEQ